MDLEIDRGLNTFVDGSARSVQQESALRKRISRVEQSRNGHGMHPGGTDRLQLKGNDVD